MNPANNVVLVRCGKRIVTGTRVATDIVLTVKHVLGNKGVDADTSQLFVYPNPEVEKVPKLPVQKVVWCSGTGDLLLLQCDNLPPDRQIANVKLDWCDHQQMSWRGEGFPALDRVNEEMVHRPSFPVDGQLHPGSEGVRGRYILTGIKGPKKSEDWKGISGSPVFTDNHFLIAVIHERVEKASSSLKAIPLNRLSDEDKASMRQHLPRYDDSVQLEQAKQWLCDYLQAQEMDTQSLKRYAIYAGVKLIKVDVSALVDALLDGGNVQTLNNYLRVAYQANRQDNQALRQQLADFCAHLAPAVFSWSMVHTLSATINACKGTPIALPVFHRATWAILVAGVDVRKVEYLRPLAPAEGESEPDTFGLQNPVDPNGIQLHAEPSAGATSADYTAAINEEIVGKSGVRLGLDQQMTVQEQLDGLTRLVLGTEVASPDTADANALLKNQRLIQGTTRYLQVESEHRSGLPDNCLEVLAQALPQLPVLVSTGEAEIKTQEIEQLSGFFALMIEMDAQA